MMNGRRGLDRKLALTEHISDDSAKQLLIFGGGAKYRSEVIGEPRTIGV
jgi:hypothetical protein